MQLQQTLGVSDGNVKTCSIDLQNLRLEKSRLNMPQLPAAVNPNIIPTLILSLGNQVNPKAQIRHFYFSFPTVQQSLQTFWL